MILTIDQYKAIFNGQIDYNLSEQCIEQAKWLRIHASGEYPSELIDERRPSESAEVLAYRKKIYQPITKGDMARIINLLNKIRRSSDWSVRFNVKDFPPIVSDNGLDQYLTYNLPKYTSLTNWAFVALLRQYVLDANSMCAIVYDSYDIQPNQLPEPVPMLFYSDEIISYVPNEYFAGQHNGLYYVVGLNSVEVWGKDTEDKSGKKYVLLNEHVHDLGYLQAFKIKGVLIDTFANDELYESRYAGLVPHFNEAVREYSDLQAEVVNHIHSESWEYGDECGECKGNGRIKAKGVGFMSADRTVTCSICDGSGVKPKGPYSAYYIKPSMAGENPAPTPPKGYIQKDVDIVKVQDERISKHIYKGLEAVNMQFLSDVPLAESGIAKSVDRDDANNTIHATAEDIVWVMDMVALMINDSRYAVLIPSQELRDRMLPVINVPEKLDIISTEYLENALKTAKESGLSPVIITAMQLEYANKKFSADPEIKDRLSLIISLDPLAGVSEDDKMAMLSNKGITQLNYVVSSNITAFVNRAINEVQNFVELEYARQKEIIEGYANEQLSANSIGASIINDINAAGVETSNSLKESVGGLTGMIDIAKAVASGLYDLDAAVALVSDRFGITEDEARKQLGTPNISNSDTSIEKVQKLT